MFSGQTRGLPYIRNYKEAKTWWDGHPQSKRSAYWNDHQRPLRNTAQHHYRLESLEPERYVDVVLYQTVVARYYKPDAQGYERRLFMGHDTITSRKSMADVLGHWGERNTEITTNEIKVMAPIYKAWCFSDDDSTRFSADFLFAQGDRLVRTESKHTRHWQMTPTQENRELRADVRKAWTPYLDLMMYRLPEFEENVEFTHSAGRPFGASPIRYTVRNMGFVIRRDEEPTAEHLAAFVEFTQEIFNQLASKRGYAQDGFNMPYVYGTRGTLSTYADLKNPITAVELRRTLANRIVDLCAGNPRSGEREIPQFVAVEEMPKSNVFVAQFNEPK